MPRKTTFRSYLKQIDDLTLSKTRRRMNSSDPKKRVYGVSEEEQEDLEGLQDINSKDLEGIEDVGDTQLEPDEDVDVESEPDDPDRQGVIRLVKGARLVFKRQSPDGNFEELWVYNTGDNIKNGLEKQKAILAGTDIPPKRTKSEDGGQNYMLTTLGNAQLLYIQGLPN